MIALFEKLVTHKRLSCFLAIVWTLLILVACFLPGSEIPNLRVPLADKWVHFIIFAGFSFLWLLVLSPAKLKMGLLIFLASLLLGYAVELIQGSGISPGRAYDLMDVVADAIGGLIGIVLFFLFQYRAMRKPKA